MSFSLDYYKTSSLSLEIFLVLKSILSDIHIGTSTPGLSNTFYYPISFSL